MRKTLAVVLAAGLLLLAAAPVWAHHAFAAEFDADKPIKFKGTVTKMEWINPHVVSFCMRIFSTGHMARRNLVMSNTPTEKPPIYTDVYGKIAPDAARAEVGARSIEQIREATDARRNARPGQYDR